jgi:hypothetical protein
MSLESISKKMSLQVLQLQKTPQDDDALPAGSSPASQAHTSRAENYGSIDWCFRNWMDISAGREHAPTMKSSPAHGRSFGRFLKQVPDHSFVPYQRTSRYQQTTVSATKAPSHQSSAKAEKHTQMYKDDIYVHIVRCNTKVHIMVGVSEMVQWQSRNTGGASNTRRHQAT